jgi:hypothetical protein
MPRPLFNYLGENVGSMPDDTPDDVYQHSLAIHAEPPPSEAIQDVSPRQIRTALVLSGISLEQVETALNSLPEPQKSLAKIEWEYSVAFKRSRPLVSSVGQMLGWTDQQLDNLWKFAITL